MREILIYLIAAIGSLFILGYSIHMVVGGLVSEETETWLIVAASVIGIAVIVFMAVDIVRRRRRM